MAPKACLHQYGQRLCSMLFPFHISNLHFGLPRVTQWSQTHLPVQEMQETQVQSLGREDPLE